MGIPEKRCFSLDRVASRHTLIICICGSSITFLASLHFLCFVGLFFNPYHMRSVSVNFSSHGWSSASRRIHRGISVFFTGAPLVFFHYKFPSRFTSYRLNNTFITIDEWVHIYTIAIQSSYWSSLLLLALYSSRNSQSKPQLPETRTGIHCTQSIHPSTTRSQTSTK